MKQRVFNLCATVFLLAFAFASTKHHVMTTTPPPPRAGDTATRYLALGDSYTIGQSVAENERFPFITVSLLRDMGFIIDSLRYIATTGWTTLNLQAAIARENPAGPFDVVTLLIGVNDQYQGLDTAGYRLHFTQLLHSAIGFAGEKKNHVFVLSIPDYSATPFVAASYKAGVSKEITAFNAINKEITQASGVDYIDITPLTREAANNNLLLASDGLHYSAIEHRKWAELLAAAVLTNR